VAEAIGKTLVEGGEEVDVRPMNAIRAWAQNTQALSTRETLSDHEPGNLISSKGF
jgi:hypothetical protein